MFAIAFSIMGLVPSIASTIAFSLPAGPVGMVWVGCSRSLIGIRAGCVEANVGSGRGGSLRVSLLLLLHLQWYGEKRYAWRDWT